MYNHFKICLNLFVPGVVLSFDKCSYVTTTSRQNSSITSPNFLVLLKLIFLALSFPECYINEIIYITFWILLLSVGIMYVRVIHVFISYHDIHPWISIIHSFLLLNSVPWYGCTMVWLSIPNLRNIWVASSFRKLQIKLL